MLRRCQYPGGCRTILRDGNKSDICGPHLKALAEKKLIRQETVSKQKEGSDAQFQVQVYSAAHVVKRVVKAVDFFYGASSRGEEAGISFVREVAVYLLKTDFRMSFEVISLNLKHEFNTVKRSYHKILSMVNANTELRDNLDLIRAQYQGPA